MTQEPTALSAAEVQAVRADFPFLSAGAGDDAWMRGAPSSALAR